MRSLTVLLSFLVVNGFAATSSASEKVRLAQTSVTTTCMMTCNAQYALCQSNCVSVGVTSTTPTTGVNPNPNQTCRASCTNQQLACQITCARTISNSCRFQGRDRQSSARQPSCSAKMRRGRSRLTKLSLFPNGVAERKTPPRRGSSEVKNELYKS